MMEELLGQVKSSFFYTKASQQKEKSKEKQKEAKRKTEDSSYSLLLHFWSTSEVYFLHSIYHFKALEVKNPTVQTVYDLELKRGSYGLRKTTAPGYGCYVMAWMQSHGNFSHPEVISYELLEGEVFNSKFCINPLEPISMAIERDFIVLDTDPTVKKANLVPIILGRPFLATSNAIINCRNGLMQLTFGNMTPGSQYFLYV
ncbi:hypothetical protein AAG906_020307 [Vitis piasezkii]